MTTTKANEKIKRFNEIGLHYNLVADSIYKYRKDIGDPFCKEYLPYIIAGLVSFDMGRMMGLAGSRYYKSGFAGRLEEKLRLIECHLKHLINKPLDLISIPNERENISKAYQTLAEKENGLNQRGDAFHVGATKILHFINPEAFVIVDSNASRAFKRYHDVNFINTTQPGYTVDNYIKCMEYAQKDIDKFGVENFSALDVGVFDKRTPIARIYDKLTFITGSDLKDKKI